jgi:hypothetical protein
MVEAGARARHWNGIGTAAALLLAALAAGHAAAAEHGVGLSAKSDNGLIYVPIDVSPKFRVEPYVRYSTDDTTSFETTPPQVTLTGQETETLEVGAGLFGLALPNESLRIYYGARAGYLNIHDTFELHSGTEVIRVSDTSVGYHVAPTFGFEYLFNSHFTLGGEAAYFYDHFESDQRFGSSNSDFESESIGTEAFLILRYYF